MTTNTITIDAFEKKLTYIAYLERELLSLDAHERCVDCEQVFSLDEMLSSENDLRYRCTPCAASYERMLDALSDSDEQDFQSAKSGR